MILFIGSDSLEEKSLLKPLFIFSTLTFFQVKVNGLV